VCFLQVGSEFGTRYATETRVRELLRAALD
jgi:hypothetical protein